MPAASHLRARGIAVMVVLAGALAPASAQAWLHDEHTELGRRAYAAACHDLVEEYARCQPNAHGIEDTQACNRALRVLLTVSCGFEAGEHPKWVSPPMPGEARKRAGEGAVDDFARFYLQDRYGQACALAGDWLDAPEDFFSHKQMNQIVSDIRFLGLAAKNADHFHPFAMAAYRRHRERAMALLARAFEAPDLNVKKRRFEQALTHQAFADHFLQDGFAGGHMGFNRPATSAGPSRHYHNAWNQEGRVLRALDSAFEETEWRSHGDGKLDYEKNAGTDRCEETCAEHWSRVATSEDGVNGIFFDSDAPCDQYFRVQTAAYWSVYGFLRALLESDGNVDAEENLAFLLPTLARMPSSTVFWIPGFDYFIAEHSSEEKDATGRPPRFHPVETIPHKVRTQSTVFASFITSGPWRGPVTRKRRAAAEYAFYFPDGSGSIMGPGIGGTMGVQWIDDRAPNFIAGPELLLRCCFTNELWTHGASVGFEIPSRRPKRDTSFHAVYRAQLEAGPVYLNLQLGVEQLRFSGKRKHWGPRLGVQLGWPLSVRGGGVAIDAPTSLFRD